MEFVTNYLQSERLLGLSVGVFGIISILSGLGFYIYKPQFKVFAMSLIVIGLIEASVFMTGYFYVNNQKAVDTKVEIYQADQNSFLNKDLKTIEKNLSLFFILKCTYAIIFMGLSIYLSKSAVKPLYFGVCTALMIHLAFAIVIDTFGERYTKIYKTEILKIID